MIPLSPCMNAKGMENAPTNYLPCVLLIEDSNDLQTVIQLGLELLLGVQVITSQTVDDWMVLIQHYKPDVIVLELFAGGNDVLAALKNNPQTCDIPVLGLAVRDRLQDILDAKAQGVSAIVSKPFDMDTLRDTIFHMLPPSPKLMPSVQDRSINLGDGG